MQLFSTIAAGSAFYHGSETKLGFQLDVWPSSIAVFGAYRIATCGVETSSKLFLTLSEDLEPTTLAELADRVAYLPLRNDNVTDWSKVLTSTPVQRSETVTAVALFAFACATSAPFFVCECLVGDVIVPQFIGNNDQRSFLLDKYLPELKVVAQSEDYRISCFPLLSKFGGIALGLLWALTFQENRIQTPCLEGSFFNFTRLGAWKSPFVDAALSLLTNIENTEYDDNGDRLDDIYPGAAFCNTNSPHALWHQLSADTVLESIMVADEANRILAEQKENCGNLLKRMGSVTTGRFKGLRGHDENNDLW